MEVREGQSPVDPATGSPSAVGGRTRTGKDFADEEISPGRRRRHRAWVFWRRPRSPARCSRRRRESNASVYEQLDLFGDIFERIRAQYVEEVDEKKLIEAAINGMLTSLDPHSSYLSPEDAADMRVQTRGEFGGLGIEVTQEEGLVKVVVADRRHARRRGRHRAGDFITARRRRERAGPDAGRGGRADARAGRVRDRHHRRARGRARAVRRVHRSATRSS